MSLSKRQEVHIILEEYAATDDEEMKEILKDELDSLLEEFPMWVNEDSPTIRAFQRWAPKIILVIMFLLSIIMLLLGLGIIS